MDKNMIGQTVTLNGKEFKIVGTTARSFVLEREGKHYKCTAQKMATIQALDTCKVSALERRVERDRIFDKTAKMPQTEAEIAEYFERLRADLSPENLTCDGEASQAYVRSRLREIRACWKELEAIVGRKVAE